MDIMHGPDERITQDLDGNLFKVVREYRDVSFHMSRVGGPLLLTLYHSTLADKAVA